MLPEEGCPMETGGDKDGVDSTTDEVTTTGSCIEDGGEDEGVDGLGDLAFSISRTYERS